MTFRWLRLKARYYNCESKSKPYHIPARIATKVTIDTFTFFDTKYHSKLKLYYFVLSEFEGLIPIYSQPRFKITAARAPQRKYAVHKMSITTALADVMKAALAVGLARKPKVCISCTHT